MDIYGPRGTFDVLPEESCRWQWVESTLRHMAELYGYGEVRIPIFEHTELFERGVGESTDIVQKEMYTFRDRGDRSITLRPEGTASCVRAYLQHKVYNQAQPTKWYYLGPMFRYDRPESGRYRQFHQFGLEVFGAREPAVDAEVISLMVRMVEKLGFFEYELHLNTVGCPSCRPIYRERLKNFLEPKIDKLCGDCRQRVFRNPLRVLDCKNPSCQEVALGFPSITEYICERCREHFDKVKEMLKLYRVPYILDDKLVRGLDYYTNTAFELLLPGLGSQKAVGGGGRYDGLIEELGGPPLPGIGFALGIERLLLALKSKGITGGKAVRLFDVFVAAMDQEYEREAMIFLDALRSYGIKADKDYLGRSLKAQMKYADKMGVPLVVIIGEEEVAKGTVTLRNMLEKAQVELNRQEACRAIRDVLNRLGSQP